MSDKDYVMQAVSRDLGFAGMPIGVREIAERAVAITFDYVYGRKSGINLDYGDVVALKSGGPSMVITCFEDDRNEMAGVCWFNAVKGLYEYDTIHVGLLVRV